jgi:hypothetical protein
VLTISGATFQEQKDIPLFFKRLKENYQKQFNNIKTVNFVGVTK